MECPVLITAEGGSAPLDATQLVARALNSSHLPLTFASLDGSFRFTVDYEHNTDLLSSTVLKEPSTSSTHALCHFTGSDGLGRESSLSACSSVSLSAVITTPSNLFVLSRDGAGRFVLLPQNIQSCDLSGGSFSTRRRRALVARANPDYYMEFAEVLQKRRFVEFAFIGDHSLYKKYNEDTKAVNDRLQTLANMLNSYYKPLNIEIRLVYSEVWSAADPIEIEVSGDKTLDKFLEYRKTFLREHPNDNAHMLTDVRFENAVVGKAFKGTMCSFDYSGGVNVDHQTNAALVASTIAHEMGHNFGMDHDVDYTDTCKCPARAGKTPHCIMAASAGYEPPSHWSSCSLEYLSTSLSRGIDLCLLNEPDRKGEAAVCGNGIVEDDEQCDCGEGGCAHDCCDAKTCRLTEKAKCASGLCCDLQTCKPKERATPCRAATNICDLAEFCNGETEECPADFYVQDGALCPEREDEYCYNGECGSRNDQCLAIWGPTGRAAASSCYATNTKGTVHGNCGYDAHLGNYTKCTESNMLCGRLHCDSDAERPVFGNPSSVTVANSHVYNRDRKEYEATCYVIQTAYETNGQRRHTPGMVLDGTKCGKESVCLKTKCVPLADITKTSSKCDDNCNGHGVCNNMGNCHCINGYGGVSCNIPGLGGSVNSNPANYSRGTDVLIISLVFLFLCIAAFVAATIHWKRKGKGFLPAIIWRDVKERLRLRGILIPTRHAPPPPTAHHSRMKKNSLNAAWGDLPGGDVVTYSAAPPRVLAAPLGSPSSSPDPLLSGPMHFATSNGYKPAPLVAAPSASMVASGSRSPTLTRPRVAPPSAPARPRDSAIVQLYHERGQELGIRTEAPPPPGKAKVVRSESQRPDVKPPPPPHKPKQKSSSPEATSAAPPPLPTKPPKVNSTSKEDIATTDVKGLAARFEKS